MSNMPLPFSNLERIEELENELKNLKNEISTINNKADMLLNPYESYNNVDINTVIKKPRSILFWRWMHEYANNDSKLGITF